MAFRIDGTDAVNNEFVDQNVQIGQYGTNVPAVWLNMVQDEINNTVSGFGLTPDKTNNTQMITGLKSYFAPVNSPSLTGIPLTQQPGSNAPANQIATVEYVNSKAMEATVGYTPVHEGGGTNMGSNNVYIGWANDASGLMAQVDLTPLGKFVFQENDDYTYGIQKFGYNHNGGGMAAMDSQNTWHWLAEQSWTTTQITNAQNATQTWVSNNFLTDSTWNAYVNQKLLTSSNVTFASIVATGDIHVGNSNWLYTNVISPPSGTVTISGSGYIAGDFTATGTANANTLNVKAIGFTDGGNSSIYQDSNTSNIVFHTNNGSDHYNTINNDGSMTFGGNVNVGGELFANTIGNEGSGWITMNSNVNVVSALQQGGQSVATQSWVGANYVNESQYANDFSSGDGRVFNHAWSGRFQGFTVQGVVHYQNGMYVSFPQAFGGTPVSIVCTTAAGVDMDVSTQNWSAQGFYIMIPSNSSSSNQPVSVLAMGPK